MKPFRDTYKYLVSHRRFSFGLGTIGLMVAICLFAARSSRYFPENAPLAKRSTVTLNQSETVDLLGSIPTDEIETDQSRFDVSYPSSMRENETKTIELNYAETTIHTVHGRQTNIREKLRAPAIITLQTAVFDIAPKATMQKPKGQQTPIEYVWTITPKKEGEHLVLLDLSALYRTGGTDTQLRLNGVEQSTDDSAVLRLPIRVYNVWSVRRTTFDALSGLVALIGFALTYPLLQGLLKRRLRKAAKPVYESGHKQRRGKRGQS